MTDEPLLLGVDLGTTTCRAVVFDLAGREVAGAAVETPVRYPRPLWAEVDPEQWWRNVVEVLRATLGGGVVAPQRIAGVGVSGLMHAPVLVDGAGDPVAPAMLWMDQRCAPQVDALRREAQGEADVLASTVSGPKLRWLAEERPEALARAARLLLPKDFIRLRLGGAAGSDPNDAGGTGLYDRDAGTWRWDLVERCRVPRRLLPELRPPGAAAGFVSPEAARQTGLLPGTPLATGSGDTACTRLGAGRPRPGEACLYLGTAAWIAGPAPPPAGGGAAALRTFGATSTTGAALRWLRDVLAPPDGAAGDAATYASLTHRAAGAPPGAEGLFFLPHLMGERGPVPDPLARGALAGLTLRHGQGHIARAVLEGTAFHLRRLIEGRFGDSPPAGAIACGGAARSALWMQILADVTRLPLRVPAVVEAAALGAAILGGVAAGALDEGDEAGAGERMVRSGTSYAPHPEGAERYEALYERYRSLDDLLAPWFRAGAG